MRITAIPAFKDNYIWAIENQRREVFVVDPGDASPVITFLQNSQAELAGILITHHHTDHTGGIAELTRLYDVPVYGPAGGHIKGITNPLSDAAEISILGRKSIVLSVPGHTLDHIAYYMTADTQQPGDSAALFCGDTLFAGGCGRLFEGTAEMMYTSLRRISELPDDTRVFCAHEYTLNNLAFAQHVEPGNDALATRIRAETDKRAIGLPTLPSTILLERRTNPFLRCHTLSLKTNVGQNVAQISQSDVETFAIMRRLKDQA